MKVTVSASVLALACLVCSVTSRYTSSIGRHTGNEWDSSESPVSDRGSTDSSEEMASATATGDIRRVRGQFQKPHFFNRFNNFNRHTGNEWDSSESPVSDGGSQSRESSDKAKRGVTTTTATGDIRHISGQSRKSYNSFNNRFNNFNRHTGNEWDGSESPVSNGGSESSESRKSRESREHTDTARGRIAASTATGNIRRLSGQSRKPYNIFNRFNNFNRHTGNEWDSSESPVSDGGSQNRDITNRDRERGHYSNIWGYYS